MKKIEIIQPNQTENLRHAVGWNFLAFVVEIVSQGVVVVLVENKEGHTDRTTVGIKAVI